MSMLLVAILVLAAGTFSLRIAGPLLRTRFELPERFEQLMSVPLSFCWPRWWRRPR
jgi:hypothetical protein